MDVTSFIKFPFVGQNLVVSDVEVGLVDELVINAIADINIEVSIYLLGAVDEIRTDGITYEAFLGIPL